MSLTTAYLTTAKNLEAMLNSIQSAQAPERFTIKFLESLEHKSTSDRLIIGVLKGLGFLDDASAPTDLYFRFLDQTEAKRVLAGGVRKAYDDLFRLNVKAYELTEAEVKNKLKTLTQGQKSEGVLTAMAKTFLALCSLADWTTPSAAKKEARMPQEVAQEPVEPTPAKPLELGQLCYNIQIVLPPTRDTAVYDALFRSLKEHLLK